MLFVKMSKDKFIEALRAIKTTKEENLKNTDVALIDYTVLQEEIKDVDYALEGCELDDDECNKKLNTVYLSTTSGSLYHLVQNYLLSDDMETVTLQLWMYNSENSLDDSIDEINLEVPKKWLEGKVFEKLGECLEDFLNEYTCDTIDWIYELAVSENQIVSIDNPIIELGGFKFRLTYLDDALEYFNKSYEELVKMDLKVYPTYEAFHKSYYSSYTSEQLIDLMYQQDIAPPDSEYLILKNGEVIYIQNL